MPDIKEPTNEVCIVVPMYKNEMNPYEKISFEQTYKMLSNFPITFIHPKGLDLIHLTQDYPTISFESFDDNYFTNIAGYNRLMMSTTLYKRFQEYKYILVAQLDTYIFNNDLLTFCDKGYDYIGAPWLRKKAYNIWPISYFIDQKQKRSNSLGRPCKQNLFNKIGNGGLSLRKVDSHINAIEKYRDKKDIYLSNQGMPIYNEDVFFSLEIAEFKYPTVEEALKFSFDKYPAYCYELNNKELPFGCHGWPKWKWKGFWKKFIEFPTV